MRHEDLVSATGLARADVETVLDRAAEIAADPGSWRERHAGTLLALWFFEPSTRTRMSFDAAMKRLGGDTVDMGPVESSSVKKGESLADTVQVRGLRRRPRAPAPEGGRGADGSRVRRRAADKRR